MPWDLAEFDERKKAAIYAMIDMKIKAEDEARKKAAFKNRKKLK